jgi:class 3 adenylate cyclase
MVDIPDVSYARAGGVAIAYQVVGAGPPDLVFSPFLSNLFFLWQLPPLRRFLDRLAEATRLIVFNPRGTGLSDRPRGVTLESRMDDIIAVFDTAGVARASLLGVAESANSCALFAATYPERCERLILFAPYARLLRTDDYPYGTTREAALAELAIAREQHGKREFVREFTKQITPRYAEDQEYLEWVVWNQRLAASPAAAAEFWRMTIETDITEILGSIHVPTLVMYRADHKDVAEYVATRIPGSRSLQLPGTGYAIWDEQGEDTAGAIVHFVRGEAPREIPDSVLATVLFTDIVGSSEHAARLGDRAWRDLLERHHGAVRAELARHRGVEVDTAGDGFFCRFDGPARAISCARAIVQASASLGLQVRAGIHTGECEVAGPKITGLAVHVGARVAAAAAPGEVLVSGTVKDLVAGSGFLFDDRGERELKGIPGGWRLYAVTSNGRGGS